MFSHIMIGSNDVARSKKFYDALFTAMGAQPGTEDARGRVAYSHNGGRFMISKPIDGKPASHANGGTIGLYRPELTLTRQGSCIEGASRVADVAVWGGGSHNVCLGDPR